MKKRSLPAHHPASLISLLVIAPITLSIAGAAVYRVAKEQDWEAAYARLWQDGLAKFEKLRKKKTY